MWKMSSPGTTRCASMKMVLWFHVSTESLLSRDFVFLVVKFTRCIREIRLNPKTDYFRDFGG